MKTFRAFAGLVLCVAVTEHAQAQNMFVANSGAANNILEFTPGGAQSTFASGLSNDPFGLAFNRAGNLIPGVTPQFLNIRMVYDQPKGALRGVGGYLEEDIRAAFFLDNANLLRAPGSNTLNLNLHYNPSADHGLLSRLNFYLEVKNVTSKAYVASASNITDSLNTTTGAENGVATLATSGVFYSGPPRSFYGGVRIRLRQ